MDEALWALGRGTGVASLLLITVSVLLGILTRSGRPAFGLPRFAVTLVHRNASMLAMVFLVIHIVSLFFDPYAQLTLVDFVIPFLGADNTVWLGLGTLTFDLLIAITVTALLRNRIGLRAFRIVHWLTYAMWPIALAHAIGNGTDSGAGWFIALVVVTSASVLAAVIWRVSARFVEYRSTRLEKVA
jgi:predicted ferric reductase